MYVCILYMYVSACYVCIYVCIYVYIYICMYITVYVKLCSPDLTASAQRVNAVLSGECNLFVGCYP